MNRFVACIFGGLLCFQAAQAAEPPNEAAVYIGGGIPVTKIDFSGAGGGSEYAGSGGLAAGAQVLFRASDRILLGLDGSYIASGEQSSTSLLPPAVSKLSSEKTTALFLAKAELTQGRVVPYFVGGVGFAANHLEIKTAPPPGMIWNDTHTSDDRAFVDSTKTTFAYALGVGLDLNINSQLFAGAEARLVGTAATTYDTTAFGASATDITGIHGPLNDWILGVHLGTRFGASGADNARPAEPPPQRTLPSDHAL